ncbi:MAG: 1-deoxy-D-xylulose-5-phosphate reductoisomerase, partial [Acidobacteriota bacterium]|nr:1-deoxy-D-xylulose-5-phosphate reductoisomerase [Acidobacteriota bacterium]MDQ2839659.1 1-deoxy-D-xylulose-5-phosphate reductoisomerase [Acidobacteriota bacterium]
MKLTLLGSTGSIGLSTLDVVRQNSERFQVYALVAGRNVEELSSQILEFRPAVAIMADDAGRDALRSRLLAAGLPRSEWPELDAGRAAKIHASTAPEVGFVMSAIVGVEGLEATYQAIRQKKRIGLANKEVL